MALPPARTRQTRKLYQTHATLAHISCAASVLPPVSVSALAQAAFEVLIDPKQRAVYDTWAKELQYRLVALHVQVWWASAACDNPSRSPR